MRRAATSLALLVLAAGTALLAEGVVEYEVDQDRLGVTLLRAVGMLAKPILATRPIWAGPSTPTPEGQCLGASDIELAVLTEVSADQLVDEWERFNKAIFRGCKSDQYKRGMLWDDQEIT